MSGCSSTSQPLCSTLIMQASDINFSIGHRGNSKMILLLEGSGSSGAVLKQQSIFKDLFQKAELQN